AAGQTPPRLLTGAEQDADVAALLAGHLESGTGPAWPDPLTAEVRVTARFRAELRDLFARATEAGIDPRGLRELGRRVARPEWIAAGEFFDEYLDVVARAREEQRDPSELIRLSIAVLDDGEPGERIGGLRLVVIDDLP